MAPRFHHIIAASSPTLNSSMKKPSYASLPLAGKSSALNFAQGLHSAQNGDCAKDSHWEENVSEGHAAVVEEVDELDRKDRAKEGRVGQWGRTQGLGKAAEVRAQETEPLCKSIGSAAVICARELGCR